MKPLKHIMGQGRTCAPLVGIFHPAFGLRRHPIFKRRRMHTGMDFVRSAGVQNQSRRLRQSHFFRLLNVGMAMSLFLTMDGGEIKRFHHFTPTNGKFWFKKANWLKRDIDWLCWVHGLFNRSSPAF